MDVAKRITFLREKKGYSVNKLANLAGVSQSFLRSIELSQAKPTVETLSFLCDALGIHLHDFFEDPIAQSPIDPCLLQEIIHLTPEQQRNLLEFLRSTHKN